MLGKEEPHTMQTPVMLHHRLTAKSTRRKMSHRSVEGGHPWNIKAFLDAPC